MKRLKLTLAYTGTAYAGWQIQAEGEVKGTIQNELEKALARITGEPLRVHGAGRTDSGVHAEGQVAHVDVPEKDIDWLRAINALLPFDIRVMSAVFAPSGFHSRYDATGKLYAYTLFMGPGPVPPRLEPYAWRTPVLDLDGMDVAAGVLTGRHDFVSFQNAGTPVADTTRTVWSIKRENFVAGPMRCPEEWPVATWFFHGEGFLKQMVRNLMGIIVYAGLGKAGADDIRHYLDAKNRSALPSVTAPAKGLSLLCVEYPPERL